MLMNEAEVWEWKEHEEIEKIQEKYIRRNQKKEVSNGKIEKDIFERNGYASKEIERLRNERRAIIDELRMRDEDTEGPDIRERIRQSWYHAMYEMLISETL